MDTDRSLLFSAWKKLVQVYVVSFAISLVAGTVFVKVLHVQPERLFELSSKRLSYAYPVFESGVAHGIDMGVLLFAWNIAGAMITLFFIYAAALFDPDHSQSPPRWLRSIFCGRSRMKLLCYLPGCAKIEAEPLRRLYVWLMVPFLGLMLLGIESGLQVSTATALFGSFFSAFVALLPHGVIEIPAFALAGAVPYSANLLIGTKTPGSPTHLVFQKVETHKRQLPILMITALVIVGLLLAGLIEAHVTPLLSASP
ncbi:conserved uncharacterized membrane protein, DUF95 [Desulfosarcina variabilis str. Montpellier]|uniref:stage II sporulation protein M n=1 Tax=Desulfosarcina variabilis TaxID=2300 RepID=UPI003AFA879F